MYKGRREHLEGTEYSWPVALKTKPVAVSMEDNTFKLIEYWKKHSPRPAEQIPFGAILTGLGTPYSAVELKEEAVGRWGVSSQAFLDSHPHNDRQFHLRGERKAAEFSFAGVIAYVDDERTGNLVPEGEESPLGLDSRKRYV